MKCPAPLVRLLRPPWGALGGNSKPLEVLAVASPLPNPLGSSECCSLSASCDHRLFAALRPLAASSWSRTIRREQTTPSRVTLSTPACRSSAIKARTSSTDPPIMRARVSSPIAVPLSVKCPYGLASCMMQRHSIQSPRAAKLTALRPWSPRHEEGVNLNHGRLNLTLPPEPLAPLHAGASILPAGAVLRNRPKDRGSAA